MSTARCSTRRRWCSRIDATDVRGAGSRGTLVLAGLLILPILLLAALVPGLALFPPLSDADYVLFDGVGYAFHAEHPDSPASIAAGGAFNSHHLLFHVTLRALTPIVALLPVEHPGFVASRLLSGLALFATFALLVAACGRGRIAFGLALCALLVAARGILLDAAVGETILPACAAGLWALLEATRAPPRVGRAAVALGLALLVRQDSVFLVPAVAIALVSGAPRGERIARPFRALSVVGLVVAACYLAAWKAAPLDLSLHDYLLGMATKGSWSSAAGFGASAAFLQAAALAWALVGRVAPIAAPDWLAVAAWCGALVAGAALARGGRPFARMIVALMLVVVPRLFFFGWFDPSNWEWWLLPLVLACGVAARAAESDVKSPRTALATVVVLAAAVFVASRHAGHTATLRERRLHDAIAVAVERGGPRATFVTLGDRAALDLLVRGVTAIRLDDQPALPMPIGFAATVERVAAQARASATPLVFVVDRFVRDGSAHATRDAEAFLALDRAARADGLVPLEHDGVVFGFGVKLSR